MAGSSIPNPIVMIIVLGAVTLAPFALVMITSFVKISVVLSILRNALGTQSVPPNQVITGLAFVLSFFIMTPVARQMYQAAGTIPETHDMFSEASVKTLFEAFGRGREPLRHFLAKHAHKEDRTLFVELAQRLDENADSTEGKITQPDVLPGISNSSAAVSSPSETAVTTTLPAATSQASFNAALQPATPPVSVVKPSRSPLSKDDFQVLIPSFVTSQLKEAFEVGFLIFIPFVIIDMVIANILLAMGMSMLSPSVISLPFKLLLFVLVDGWFLIIRGLVLSYV
jgi:type III secretion protein R